MQTNKNINLYMFGRLISYIGTGIQQIAIPLYILDVTNSALMMSIFSALNLVPNLLTAPLAGILGDKKNRKTIMIITDIGRAVLVIILGSLAIMDNLNIYVLFIFQIFISMMDSIFNGSSTALMPELTTEDEMMKVMSKRGIIDSVSMIIGPAIGGIIYGFLGIKAVFIINGISFILSAISSYLLIYKRIVNKIAETKITMGSFIKDNLEAIRFIKRNKGVIQLFSYALIINLLLSPLLDVMLPYIIKSSLKFSSQEYGWVMSAFVIGILIANIVIAPMHDKLNIKSKNIMKTGLVVQVSMLLVFAIAVYPSVVQLLGGTGYKLYAVIIMITLTIGIFNAFANTPLNTNLQILVPNEMKSRFFSLLSILSQGAVPLGAIVFGILLDNFKYYNIVLIVSLIGMLVTLIFMKIAVEEVFEPATNVECKM